MSEIVFSHKYQPLFDIIEGQHPEVDTILITGGRGSAKSFVTATASLIALIQHNWDILYTRFTNISIVDSIKPEVDDKVELLNLGPYVQSSQSHIYNGNGNRIAFKGIKTGSKQQTANLKSLSGFNCFIVEEGEEIPDLETFEKVFLSIRSKEKRNLTIIILNPASVHHWIYVEFFEKMGVEAGSNIIKENICYIHTSYLDVPQEYLAPNILMYYERMKERDPQKYERIVLGSWTDGVKHRVYTGWAKVGYKAFKELPERSVYGVDWGKNHKFGIVECKFQRYQNNFYSHELNWKSENEILSELTPAQRKQINDSEGGIIVYVFTKLQIPKDAYIVCDSAVPDNILLLRKFGWEYALGIDKPKGSVMAGITLVESTNNFYTDVSSGIDYEFRNYQYKEDRLGVIDDEVLKENDDLMDPIRYVRRWVEKNSYGS